MKSRLYRSLAILAVMMLVLAGMMAGCSRTAGEPETRTRIITDMSGREVEIPVPEDIERVAVLTSPTVQMMYIVGEQDKLCAITTSTKRRALCQQMDSRIADMPDPRQTAAQINIESLLETNPQFCMGGRADMQVVRENTDIPTLELWTPEVYNLEHQKEQVRFFGQVFGKEGEAEEYCTYMDDVLAMVGERVADLATEERVNVYVGFGADHLVTYGGDTYFQERLEVAGCTNAAESLSSLGGKEAGLGTVSMEDVLSWNPELIVIDIGEPEDVLNDPLWAEVDAVKNGRVYELPMGIFIWNRPSAEAAVLFTEWMAFNAYPDRFSDMTIEDEIKRFYSEILDYELSDEDVYSILNP
jgi:iron complex transport system substrate-binding protein